MARIALSKTLGLAMLVGVFASGCGQVPTVPAQHAGPVVLVPDQRNAVARWHDIGAATVVASVATVATEAEKYAAFPADMATMHLAMYDAVMAIDRRYQPFLYAPVVVASDASLDAATAAAAYRVLQSLFPSRSNLYQSAYDQFMAAIPDGAAKTRGIDIGTASADMHLKMRSLDGRARTLDPYVENPAPGHFRGKNPVNRHWIAIRPFNLTSVAQFRPAPPPAMNSVQYATDYNEVKELGGVVSATRTAAQQETAFFHAEAPGSYFTRNFGRFARTTGDPVAAARLMAAIYTNYADAIAACLDAKYHYDAWRPQTAIPMADADNNPATMADAAWKPLYPTPNHPEYPAAHSCSSGSLGELLRQYYGTEQIQFTWTSKNTNTTRTYANIDGLNQDSTMARIYGGMHFRFSTTAGQELGKQVARWTMEHAFKPVPR